MLQRQLQCLSRVLESVLQRFAIGNRLGHIAKSHSVASLFWKAWGQLCGVLQHHFSPFRPSWRLMLSTVPLRISALFMGYEYT
jgi:hypothetical protein